MLDAFKSVVKLLILKDIRCLDTENSRSGDLNPGPAHYE